MQKKLRTFRLLITAMIAGLLATIVGGLPVIIGLFAKPQTISAIPTATLLVGIVTTGYAIGGLFRLWFKMPLITLALVVTSFGAILIGVGGILIDIFANPNQTQLQTWLTVIGVGIVMSITGWIYTRWAKKNF